MVSSQAKSASGRVSTNASGEKPGRFEALDSLRGICAVMVVIMHFQTTGLISSLPIVRNSFLFVDFFFVLSGFVIAASYGDKLGSGFAIHKFMFLRLGRVYPLHIALLLAFLACELAFLFLVPDGASRKPFTDHYSIPSFFWELGLAQIFFGPESIYWNGVSWSIAAEFWTYLLFAFVFRLRRAIGLSLLFAILAFGWLVIHARQTGLYLFDVHDAAWARCVFGFSFGVIAYKLRDRLKTVPVPALLELLTFAIVVFAVSIVGGSPWEFGVPLLFGWTVFLFSYEQGPVTRLFKMAPFVLLGTLSYSIYMVQDLVHWRLVDVLRRVAGGALVQQVGDADKLGTTPLVGDLMSLVSVLLVVGCAWVTYHLIERPGRAWSRKIVAGKRNQSIATAEATAPAM